MPSFRKRTSKERFWEIIPGLMCWGTLVGAILLSYFQPVWAAVFVVCFDLYWILRAANGSVHLLHSYFKFRVASRIDWLDYLHKLSKDPNTFIEFLKNLPESSRGRNGFIKSEIQRLEEWQGRGKNLGGYENFYHLILLPFVNESLEVLSSSLDAVVASAYPKEKMILLLAGEERAGEAALLVAKQVQLKYGNLFCKFFTTVHPDGLDGEIKGKSANASFAVEQVLPELKKLGIEVDQVLVSNFDSDTVVHPQYFAKVTYEFLTAEKPYRSSYQPIAVYNNNIWDSPAFIRVITLSSWQFTESSRPHRLMTFSSHTMTLRALLDVGLWKRDIVNEDGWIFWQCFLKYDGDYKSIPLFLPVSLDTCLAESTWQTFINQYKQRRRWAYNVEYYPHLIWPLLKSRIPLYRKFYKLYQYVEGNYTWSTSSLIIAFLGWLPLIIGRNGFSQSIIAFNLPFITQTLLRGALIFLIASVYVNLVMLPPRPKKYSYWKSVSMYLQWFLVPIAAIVFHSLPAVEAQTRLMLGKYLEFWVTPKIRKGEVTAHQMKGMVK